MAHSQSINYNNEEYVYLTGFLFGNIDKTGQLESDIFDSEAKKNLGFLAKFALAPLFKDVIGNETLKEDDVKSEELMDEKMETESEGYHSDASEDIDDTSMKSLSAMDYSDISELADEDFRSLSFDEDGYDESDGASELVPSAAFVQKNIKIDLGQLNNTENRELEETMSMLPSTSASVFKFE